MTRKRSRKARHHARLQHQVGSPLSRYHSLDLPGGLPTYLTDRGLEVLHVSSLPEMHDSFMDMEELPDEGLYLARGRTVYFN